MKISIVSLFPQLFTEFLSTSIINRAQTKKLVEFEIIDLRQFGVGIHKNVDDRPFGGGPGMILRPDVLSACLQSIKSSNKPLVILLSASGKPFKQKTARQLSNYDHLILIAGHYEGVDQRFIDKSVDLEISIGDYVLTGGELPAMVVADAVVRLIPNVLSKSEATFEESFEKDTLEYPQYTRPEVFEGESVPLILRSGNHLKIAKWREEQSLLKTKNIRPDLLKK